MCYFCSGCTTVCADRLWHSILRESSAPRVCHLLCRASPAIGSYHQGTVSAPRRPWHFSRHPRQRQRVHLKWCLLTLADRGAPKTLFPITHIFSHRCRKWTLPCSCLTWRLYPLCSCCSLTNLSSQVHTAIVATFTQQFSQTVHYGPGPITCWQSFLTQRLTHHTAHVSSLFVNNHNHGTHGFYSVQLQVINRTGGSHDHTSYVININPRLPQQNKTHLKGHNKLTRAHLSTERFQLTNVGWTGPGRQRGNFSWVCLYSIFSDNMTQIFHKLF